MLRVSTDTLPSDGEIEKRHASVEAKICIKYKIRPSLQKEHM